jgi:hypothetical protein
MQTLLNPFLFFFFFLIPLYIFLIYSVSINNFLQGLNPEIVET